MNNKIYITIITIFSVIFSLSSFMLAKQFIDSKNNIKAFDELQQVIIAEPVIDEEIEEDIEENIELTPYEQYKTLYYLNNDFVGWITIDDTAVNYPVMQSVDRPNFYLKRNFDKQYSDYGVPYVDEKCNLSSSNNTIIYGHNMKNGTMFNVLPTYQKESFYKDHKTITFNTLDTFSEYEIIAAFKIDVSTDSFLYNTYTDMNEESFEYFIENIKAKSFYDTGISAKYGDKLLTLSTCEYTFQDGRFVVVAKKIV